MNKAAIQHTQEEYGLRPEAEHFPMMVVLSFVYVCNAGCPNCPYNNSLDSPTFNETDFKKSVSRGYVLDQMV